MKVKLEDVCERGSSNLRQSDVEGKTGEYPIYGAAGYIGNVDFYHQEKPYVAVVKDGAGIGRTMLLPAKSSVIGTMQYLLPKENILPEYLNYVVQYMHLEKYFSGATIPHIYFKDYKNEEFNCAEIGEQREIVETLKKVEKIIDARRRELQALDDLVKARFVEMFGAPFDTTRWVIKELKDISESLVDGSNVNPDYYESTGEVLFLRIQNVWRNEFRLDDSVYITSDINKRQYLDTSLKKGDLLITKIGRYYTKDSSLGRVSVYLGEDDCANYSNNIMRVRLKDTLNSEFVNVLLNLDEYQSFIKKTSKGGTDKRALSKSLIGSYPIIIPPKDLQNDFVAFVKQVDKSKIVVQKALEKAQLLFDSLMQKYFG